MLRNLLTVASAALAAQVLSILPTQADPATQQTVQTEAAGWINCADEGNHCYPDSNDVITMRYGEGDNYTYIVAKGLDRISCNNFWGNPSDDQDKKCAFTTTNLLNVAPESSYVNVAEEGDTFNLPDTGKMHWVRYGSGNSWMYTVMSGDGEQSMACTNDYFNYNPVNGTDKVCQYSNNAYYTLSEDETLTECSTEGQVCTPDVPDVVLMRYGTDNQFEWRFLHSKANTYECNNETFGPNPIHETKRCFWVAVSPSAISTVGVWENKGSCGADCAISKQISVGTTRTNSWTTSDSWSATVTESIEESFEILGVGEKVSASASLGFVQSYGFTSTKSESVTDTFTATCPTDETITNLVLYQFQTNTTESCLEDLGCAGTTLTSDYLCVHNPPTGYSGPQCVPNACREGDLLCQLPCAE
ncbi:hypothetical protein [Pseudovibrio ascidiaceicola]|uniref:hypothetical protein n=1 Tax=Pseudovibrio ascidiaceicola TaxID=285279 RepID=UPI000D693C53|nr:hypothetical protein [Pseudovibrio ascidiaceicola]